MEHIFPAKLNKEAPFPGSALTVAFLFRSVVVVAVLVIFSRSFRLVIRKRVERNGFSWRQGSKHGEVGRGNFKVVNNEINLMLLRVVVFAPEPVSAGGDCGGESSIKWLSLFESRFHKICKLCRWFVWRVCSVEAWLAYL